jgi:hypothetical protein
MCSVSFFDWHSYEIHWNKEEVFFYIDGEEQFSTPAPSGPLGLVIWIDNQFMRIDPRAYMKHGNVTLDSSQQLEIKQFELVHGE